MGTSRDYGGGPKWSGVKGAVTRTSGAGHLTPNKAATVVNPFVRQLAGSGGLGKTGVVTSGARDAGGARTSGGGAGGGRRGGGSSRVGGRRSAGKYNIGSGAAGAAQAIGAFVTDVRERGLGDALRELGLNSVDDKSPAEIANLLADALGGPASTIDAVALRAALCEVIQELVLEAQDLTGVENSFNAAAARMEEIIRDLFGCYIVERFATLVTASVDSNQGVQVTDAYLVEVRAYVDTRLQLLELDRPLSTLDWRGLDGAATVDDILARTQSVFGIDEH